MANKKKNNNPARQRYTNEVRWKTNKEKQLKKHLKWQPDDKVAKKKLDLVESWTWRWTRK